MKTETATKQVPAFDKAAYIKEAGGTISAAIRKLDVEKKTRGEIAKLLEIRYQWVRNVLITPVKNPKLVK